MNWIASINCGTDFDYYNIHTAKNEKRKFGYIKKKSSRCNIILFRIANDEWWFELFHWNIIIWKLILRNWIFFWHFNYFHLICLKYKNLIIYLAVNANITSDTYLAIPKIINIWSGWDPVSLKNTTLVVSIETLNSYIASKH